MRDLVIINKAHDIKKIKIFETISERLGWCDIRRDVLGSIRLSAARGAIPRIFEKNASKVH